MIVERIASLFSRPWTQSLASQDGGGGSGWRLIFDLLDGHRSSSGQTVTAASAIRLSAVYACVRVLSETIAQLPWHIYEKRRNGDRVVASQHLLNSLLRFPNFWQNSVEFREMAMVHLALRGNFFAEIIAGENGFATQLEPLHPDRMFRIERTDAGQLRYYYRTPQGDEQTFMQRQMFHIRALGMEGFFGLNPIEVARETFGNAMAADKFAGKFFSNNSRPSGILTSDANMTREAAERNKANWQAANAGEENWHKVAVLSNGLKWQPISISNKDSQFLETRQFSITDIARIFRIPPHLVGDLSRSSFSNIEQQGREFVDYTIMPWVRRWEEAFARDLILDADRYYLRFELGGLLRGDSAARASFYSTMINAGIMSPNEARELEDLNQIPEGDKHLVQGAMVLLEDVGKEPEPAQPPPASVPEQPEDGKEGEGDKENSEDERELAVIQILNESHGRERRTLHRAWRRERELADHLTATLESVRESEQAKTAEVVDLCQRLQQAEGDNEVIKAELSQKQAELSAATENRNRIEQQLDDLHRKREQAEVAALQVFRDRLDRLRAIERRNATEAAGKAESFMEWLSRFYPAHQLRCLESLSSVAELLSTLFGRDIEIEQEISKQLSESQHRLQAIYDNATPAEFLNAITKEVESWDSKAILERIEARKED